MAFVHLTLLHSHSRKASPAVNLASAPGSAPEVFGSAFAAVPFHHPNMSPVTAFQRPHSPYGPLLQT